MATCSEACHWRSTTRQNKRQRIECGDNAAWLSVTTHSFETRKSTDIFFAVVEIDATLWSTIMITYLTGAVFDVFRIKSIRNQFMFLFFQKKKRVFALIKTGNGDNRQRSNLCTITDIFFLESSVVDVPSRSVHHTTANASTPTLTHFPSNFGCVHDNSCFFCAGLQCC